MCTPASTRDAPTGDLPPGISHATPSLADLVLLALLPVTCEALAAWEQILRRMFGRATSGTCGRSFFGACSKTKLGKMEKCDIFVSTRVGGRSHWALHGEHRVLQQFLKSVETAKGRPLRHFWLHVSLAPFSHMHITTAGSPSYNKLLI